MTKREVVRSRSPMPAAPSGWFDRFFTDWGLGGSWPMLRRELLDSSDMLRVEEEVDGSDLIVRAEMPGIDPDKDVEISVTDHMLHLRAERREESKSEDEGTRRSEFRYGSFSRSVPLPVGATDKDVKASYKDGILEVRIPVDQSATDVRKISVERA